MTIREASTDETEIGCEVFYFLGDHSDPPVVTIIGYLPYQTYPGSSNTLYMTQMKDGNIILAKLDQLYVEDK